MIDLIAISPEVIRIQLNRPEKKNALSIAMMDELLGHLEGLSKTVRIVLLEGKGTFFCSGLDLEEVQRMKERCTEKIAALYLKWLSLDQITIAKIQGGAYAGGLGLVAASDLAFAEEGARFALPELKKGIIPGLVYYLLENQIPLRILHQWILTAEPISATKAEAAGLLNGVHQNLEGACLQIIRQLLAIDLNAAQVCKKHLFQKNDWKECFDQALKLHRRYV